MKRILHIVGTMDRAGAETTIMNLYRAIDRSQIQFDFLYFTSKKCDFDEEIESLGGRIYRVLESNPIIRMFATKKLLLKNKQWETVHAHNLFSNAFHIFAAFQSGVKQRITHAHSNNSPDKANFINLLYHFISRKIQKRYATHFLACTPAAGTFLFPNKKNIQILKNSIDTEYFAKIGDEHRNYLREQFQLDEDTLIILQLGRLNLPKNHQFSIQISKELKRKKVKHKMFFAGEGVLLNSLKEEVKRLDLENQIVFLGLRSDVAHLLSGSDLMLMPSLYEGFGVVLVEAQAVGIPSLISDTIPPDSDVGIDLIFTSSLQESACIWAEHVVEIYNNKQFIDSHKRLASLRLNGFDQMDSVTQLSELYNSMNYYD